MKKILLILLATFFLQSPAFAVLTEVTVLTKGNLTVYLFGDEHHEYYARQESIRSDIARGETLDLDLDRAIALVLETRANEQADELTKRIVLLKRLRGDHFTFMYEGSVQYPQPFLEGIKEFYNALPNEGLSQMGSEIKSDLLTLIQSKEKCKSVISMVTEKVTGKIKTINIDKKRIRMGWIEVMLALLTNIHLLELMGFDTKDVDSIIRDEMGVVSLKELCIELARLDEDLLSRDEWEAPLYDVYKKAVRLSLMSTGSDKRPLDHIVELLKNNMCSTWPEDEAMEKILALEGRNEPVKVVLLAGCHHTQNLETMLKREGFQIRYKSFEGRPEKRTMQRAAENMLRDKHFDVFFTEFVAPQQAPPLIEAEPSWWWELPRFWLYSI